jgi:serine/threonine-protein kinase
MFLTERYQVQNPITRGGMAIVYRGRDLQMDRDVALKVLREVYSTSSELVARFQRAAKAVAESAL